ncbi:MAG: hypothetical protein GXO76_02155 [Calditrichaeota bacterium]|nr:hypothetical protein [Calditrichota bacterium]
MGKAHGQTIDFSGEIAAQTFYFRAGDRPVNFGLRFIPALDANQGISSTGSVGLSVAANVLETLAINTRISYHNSHSFNWYRYWIRYATPKLEIRLGNQKINFGSAKLFRPLMWFDRLDPRDPLQLTNGIKALLVRTYFPNNATIWLWALVGNRGTKGIELFPTAERKPEFGGRIQVPLLMGELALTAHHRWVQFGDFSMPFAITGSSSIFRESRLAVDGAWDIGAGFWFESALFHYENAGMPFQWRQMGTVGLDYTFPVGNGFYVLEENFIQGFSTSATRLQEKRSYSGILVTYPLNLLDEIMAISTYDWSSRRFFHYLSWRRTTDRWQVNLAVFLIPRNMRVWGNPRLSAFNGNGFQILVVYAY